MSEPVYDDEVIRYEADGARVAVMVVSNVWWPDWYIVEHERGERRYEACTPHARQRFNHMSNAQKFLENERQRPLFAWRMYRSRTDEQPGYWMIVDGLRPHKDVRIKLHTVDGRQFIYLHYKDAIPEYCATVRDAMETAEARWWRNVRGGRKDGSNPRGES